MNTRQIEAILKNDLGTKDIFNGVYAMDSLPELSNGMYVINTDDHDEPGEHWVAVYCHEINEYFDSYGLLPQDFRLRNFLNNEFIYNNVKLQLLWSDACGFYCVYYLIHRARGLSMFEIIDTLKRSDGDFIVKNYVYSRYRPLFY